MITGLIIGGGSLLWLVMLVSYHRRYKNPRRRKRDEDK